MAVGLQPHGYAAMGCLCLITSSPAMTHSGDEDKGDMWLLPTLSLFPRGLGWVLSIPRDTCRGLCAPWGELSPQHASWLLTSIYFLSLPQKNSSTTKSSSWWVSWCLVLLLLGSRSQFTPISPRQGWGSVGTGRAPGVTASGVMWQ